MDLRGEGNDDDDDGDDGDDDDEEEEEEEEEEVEELEPQSSWALMDEDEDWAILRKTKRKHHPTGRPSKQYASGRRPLTSPSSGTFTKR